MKVINMQKEKKREMRESPPPPPKESKVRNKRNTDGDGYSCDQSLRPRAYAQRRAKAKRKRLARRTLATWQARLEQEGVTDPVPFYVDMAVELCHGTPDDRRKWLKIANRGINSFTGVLSEFEVELNNPNMGRLRKPAAAFQARLNRVLPKV